MQLAVFDLDGTITRHDTLFPYVAGYLQREPRRWPGMLGVAPAALSFLLGNRDHGRLKSAFIRCTLRGCTRAQILAWTEQFVTGLLRDGLFEDARARVSAHLQAGDRLVLMSASTDLYVPAIARALGFHEVICTGVRWEEDRLCGELTTPNRRGTEKTRCLLELQARYPELSAVAYGNARSDLDHLRHAKPGFLVNGSRTARQMAAQLGVRCLTWR